LLKSHPRRKRDHAFHDGIVHGGKELSSEYDHDRTDGEKISLVARPYPSAESEASLGDEAMEVGMEHHGLAPRVESGNDAGLCADMFGVEKKLVESVFHAGKEETGHGPHIEKPEFIQFMGDGEDHVVMTAGKEAFFLPFEPLRDLRPLALRTEAMTAGVVPVPLVVTFRAGFHMTAKFAGAAKHKSTGCFADMMGERMGPLIGRIDRLHDLLDCRSPHRDMLSFITLSVNLLPLFTI
jgi:hypothetical protein